MSNHLVSTRATAAACDRCRARLLAALDEGITARVNEAPLPDRQAEIAALLNGQWTYTLTANRHLVIRTPERINAGTPHGTIHAQHQCNGPTQLTLDDLMGNQ